MTVIFNKNVRTKKSSYIFNPLSTGVLTVFGSRFIIGRSRGRGAPRFPSQGPILEKYQISMYIKVYNGTI